MHLDGSQHCPAWFNPGLQRSVAEQCRVIADALRPNFEFMRARGRRADRRESELKRFTEEQYAALDAMETNPQGPSSRVLAGTGKTVFWRFEAARRASPCLEGGRLFLCYNRLLAKVG